MLLSPAEPPVLCAGAWCLRYAPRFATSWGEGSSAPNHGCCSPMTAPILTHRKLWSLTHFPWFAILR